MTLCDARRIHLYPVGVEPVPRSLMQLCEGRGGLQGGWDPSLPRRIAALAHHGHSSTLDRYVALVDIHHSHQRIEVYRTTPVGTWPVSRYRHREINSLRATATIAIRLMRPLALPTRSRNQRLRALLGWKRSHIQLDHWSRSGSGLASIRRSSQAAGDCQTADRKLHRPGL